MIHLPTGSWQNPFPVQARGNSDIGDRAAIQFQLICKGLVKTENQKRHPAEGVQNVCCLFSSDYVNRDMSQAVKSTGQVVLPLGKPLQLPPSNESSLPPQINMCFQMPQWLSFPSYDSGHTVSKASK